MTTSARESILSGLASSLTSSLVAEYGDGLEASRSFEIDEATTTPEATPTVRIYSQERTLADSSEVPIYNLTVQAICLLKRKSGSSELLETDGANFESWLESTLWALRALSGRPVAIFQRQGQSSLVAADSNSCWVVYEFTIQYAEEAIP